MRQAVRRASEDWRQEQGELLKKYSRKQLLGISIPSAGHKVKAKTQEGAQKELEATAKKVLKGKMKSQAKYVKEKLAKAGLLGHGLSMAMSNEALGEKVWFLSEEDKKHLAKLRSRLKEYEEKGIDSKAVKERIEELLAKNAALAKEQPQSEAKAKAKSKGKAKGKGQG